MTSFFGGGLAINAPSDRLSAAILGEPAGSWASFTPLRSNFEAFEAAMMFAQGSLHYIVLVGPSGWGKTHLVRAAAEMSVLQRRGGNIATVKEFLDRLEYATDPAPVLIDNAHEVRKKPRMRQKLLHVIEQRLAYRRPTLVCLDENHCGRLARDLGALSHSSSVVKITNPRVEERELLVMQAASKMGLDLHRSIARFISRHEEGNAHTIMGALNRLTVARGPWNTEGSLPRACGLIFPYLGGAAWDIRDVGQDVVDSVFSSEEEPEAKDACFCWLMRRIVGLPEAKVAEFLQIPPGRVYRLTSQFESCALQDKVGSKSAQARSAFLNALMM